MAKGITVIIDTDGAVHVEAHGYTGGACKTATAPLTQQLMGNPAKDVIKPEFYAGGDSVRISISQ